jgi:hypothetical protein
MRARPKSKTTSEINNTSLCCIMLWLLKVRKYIMDSLPVFWHAQLEEAERVLQEIKNSLVLEETFSAVLRASVHAFQQGNKLLFIGNGGSAADAQHLAAELVVRFR